MKYIPTIGLEIHAELRTKTKMFCSCLNDSEEREPNKNVCPVCLAHPGALPSPNFEAVAAVLKLGMALNCSLPEISKFDRKNYFYPDLPKGYQISQYDCPFAENGFLEIPDYDAEIIGSKKIRIRRVHLEEDTGRLSHAESGKSLVDFNRAGVPLAELVTEPDIASGLEARAFAEELRSILRYLKISNADMEKGEMRCEVNISVSQESGKLGTKVEIKNLNSFRAVEQAVDFEIKRQSEILESGGKVIQETRGWDEKGGETFSQRIKEDAHDYRYFPEPDLPAMELKKIFNLEELRISIPELPAEKRLRLMKQFGLKAKESALLVLDEEMSEYFEEVVSELDGIYPTEGERRDNRAKTAYNYLISDFRGILAENGVDFSRTLISSNFFAKLVDFVEKGMISSAAAKSVLRQLFNSKIDPEEIIKKDNLLQVSDEKELEDLVLMVMDGNPDAVLDYKKGKEASLQFLLGKAMGLSKGRGNPRILSEILKKKMAV